MTDRREFRDLVSPDVAHEIIHDLPIASPPETVSLTSARGRVLAERIDADIDVPGFDRASMDGYAVRGRDTFGADEAAPVDLDRIGAVHAGATPDITVDSGEAAEISTGAVMPPGADAVVIVERTQEHDDGATVRVHDAVAPGDNVMIAGTDVAAGTRALGPGTRLTPREIGLLSALGVESVPVRGRPTVGIVSTGDELVRPGSTLDTTRGQIYDVNSYTIAAGVEEAGGEAKLYPHTGDDYDEMEQLLIEAADECDLVLSSGSTSASAVDVIYRVIESRGDLRLHGVAVKPGKPMLVGELDGSAYIGLPGYPVSALTIFRLFVAPAIRSVAGQPNPQTATLTGKMAVEERYAEGRLRLMPVGTVSNTVGETLVYPVDKGSGATTSLVEADGVVAVDPDTEYLATGESVTVELFSPDVRPPTLLGVGEDDPVFSRILDTLSNPRYLAIGSREGRRRLRNDVPDIAVVAGPSDRSLDTISLGSWKREWGLLVPTGNPANIDELSDIIEMNQQFVNRRTDSGLRRELDATIDSLADDRNVSREKLTQSIQGYERGAKGVESPARAIIQGNADTGLGLRITATERDLEFISLGTQQVSVEANPNRIEKSGVEELSDHLDSDTVNIDSYHGYEH
ncbi:molybdopterin biosynthesis protein [Haloquadratum walsbyi]|jgi:molybdenum cofactor synthesis domain-containing protein|uniref:Molybdopterin molybdenumtransferase n=1 Tax=Haloquadratum walsbyi (strain DSM 16790 / HBSQ001) TaxID=362976 RepID=Q18F23_HALWD|nr:molybdopterin biosynthesis protein [Haloquadratum walsbyi]CAJ53441.1 molybdopterin molybdenumtransferase [Haloquadratum walsbyi DSM 16790]